MTGSPPTPFPWTSLDATTASELAALGDVRRWVETNVRLDAFSRALNEILGSEIRILVRRARPWTPRRGEDGGIGVLLAISDRGATATGAVLDIEPALATAIVARAIRRPVPVIVDTTRPPSPGAAGALAAILVAAARRAHADVTPRVLSAGDARTFVEDLSMRGEGEHAIELTFTVILADDAFRARLLVLRQAAFAAPDVPWTLARLSALGGIPLTLPVVGVASRSTVADVAALAVGDVWLPGAWGLGAPINSSTAMLAGPVFLAAPASETGVRAQLVEGSRIVLSGDVERLDAVEATMVEGEGKNTWVSAVGDVPVLVRVEIGEARMTAREWASLGQGDVVTLGRRVGGQVLLRVGGVPVALGELVSVDGEVGVRIGERLTGDTPSP
jgi:flagellar motor switch/type III secretory pathway protein FliN